MFSAGVRGPYYQAQVSLPRRRMMPPAGGLIVEHLVFGRPPNTSAMFAYGVSSRSNVSPRPGLAGAVETQDQGDQEKMGVALNRPGA